MIMKNKFSIKCFANIVPNLKIIPMKTLRLLLNMKWKIQYKMQNK